MKAATLLSGLLVLSGCSSGGEVNTIGASGGTIATDDVRLTFPDGALTSDTEITVTPQRLEPTNGLTALSTIQLFEPAGLTFMRPVRVEFLRAMPDERSAVYWSAEVVEYERLKSTISGKVVSADITHFSKGLIAAPAIWIMPSELPNARSGQAYQAQFVGQGGIPPYRWSVVRGSLPAGLVLDATTASVSGTPTTPGTFEFLIRVVDDNSVDSAASFSITVES